MKREYLFITSNKTKMSIIITFHINEQNQSAYSIYLHFVKRSGLLYKLKDKLYKDDEKTVYLLSEELYKKQGALKKGFICVICKIPENSFKDYLDVDNLRTIKAIGFGSIENLIEESLRKEELSELSEIFFLKESFGLTLLTKKGISKTVELQPKTTSLVIGTNDDNGPIYYVDENTVNYINSQDIYYLINNFDKTSCYHDIYNNKPPFLLENLAKYCYIPVEKPIHYYKTILSPVLDKKGLKVELKADGFVYDKTMKSELYQIGNKDIELYSYKDFLVTKKGYIKLIHVNKSQLKTLTNYNEILTHKLTKEQKEQFRNQYTKHILLGKKGLKGIVYISDKQEFVRLGVE